MSCAHWLAVTGWALLLRALAEETSVAASVHAIALGEVDAQGLLSLRVSLLPALTER